jgi:hypothetical protein
MTLLRASVLTAALAIASFAGMLLLASGASAATVQIGQLAPSSTDGGCIDCTNLQVETVSPAPSYEVPAGSWTLTSWSAQGGLKGGSVKLRIFRPTAIPGQFRLVAESPLETIAAATIAIFPAEIPVEPGDRLGLQTGPGIGGINDYPSTYSAPLGNRQDGVVGVPTVGQTVGTGGEFEVGNSGGHLLNIAATLTSPTESLGVTSGGEGSTVAPVPATGSTVPPAPAPATLRLAKLKKNRGKGTANLFAQVSGPGSLTLTARGIVKTSGTSKGAGVVKLVVIAKGAAKRLLMKTGKAKVRATIVFAPAGGGAAVTAYETIVLSERRGARRGAAAPARAIR